MMNKDGLSKKQKAARKRVYLANQQIGIRLRDEIAVAKEMKKQDGRCAICRMLFNVHGTRFERPQIDHCHDSLSFRGLLCNHCNLMLGFARDNVEILRAAIKYLLTHRG